MADEKLDEQLDGHSDEAKLYKKWQNRIEKEKKAHKEFRDQAEKAEKAARDEGELPHAFNIFWSTKKVTHAAVYASRPKPDVRRRYQKPNPEEKELARLVERAIEYQVDTGYFDACSHAAVDDYITAGLGVPRVYLDVETAEGEADPETGEPIERITSQYVGIEHIPWRYFHWEPGRTWENMGWIAFESFQPKEDLEKEYGVKIKSGSENEGKKRKADEYANEVQVFEIWDKQSGRVLVYAPSHPVMLEVRDDSLNLQGFYPCPRPAFANLKSDELIPKPDYCFIEPQVEELNRLSGRIKSLAGTIKANGFTDASIAEIIASLHSDVDGTIKPVVGLLDRLNGLPADKLITYLPMLETANAIQVLEGQREQTKQQIYEVVGISDIIRGSTHASETAAAQQLKGQWANVRLSEKSGEVARLWRDVFRMFAEIICEHFDPQVLMLQTGVQITPGMYQMMKSDIGRSFAIDIETDSTIAKDDYEDRQQTMELIDTILAKLEQVVPALMQEALPVEFVQEALLMVVSKHKHGKQLEDAIMGLSEHWSSIKPVQQQLQQMQQQLEQAGQQNQQMQQELQKFNEVDMAAKDRESKARAAKEMSAAKGLELDNEIKARRFDLEDRDTIAGTDKTIAETNKIRAETVRTIKEPVQQSAPSKNNGQAQRVNA